MSDRLADLLEHPEHVADVPAAELPALLAVVSAEAARLDTLRTILAARLVAPAAPANGREADDLLTDVAEVARLVRRSPSWVRKQGHRLPGFRQPAGKGTRVAWSRRALEAWAGEPNPMSPP